MNFNFGKTTGSGTSFGTQQNRSAQSAQQVDTTSGQDAAFQIGQELAQAKAAMQAQMLSNPMAAASSIARIRQMQAYLNAYRGGYQLPDQEVIQGTRVGGQSNSQNASASENTGRRFSSTSNFGFRS